MNQYEILTKKLAEARDELFNYDRMFESGMINGAEHVIDEMVTEIKRLRKVLEFYASPVNYHTKTDECWEGTLLIEESTVQEDYGDKAREALNENQR